MAKYNRSKTAAKLMNGKGWYGAKRLSEEMKITGFIASQTIQSVRRSPKYQTEEDFRDGKAFVKVTRIYGNEMKVSKETVFYRAVVFGEPIPESFKKGDNNEL
jgi:hypothetical protein